MESEKVKEIKKRLEEYIRQYSNFKGAELCKEALTLINELVYENEKLKQHKRELQGGQQDLTRRIAELEKENKSLYDSYHQGYKVGYEYGKQDAFSSDRAESDNQTSETTQSDYRLKQFAERLKDRGEIKALLEMEIMPKVFKHIHNKIVKSIDETLKECLCDNNQ